MMVSRVVESCRYGARTSGKIVASDTQPGDVGRTLLALPVLRFTRRCFEFVKGPL